jgi:hypothetical protein
MNGYFSRHFYFTNIVSSLVWIRQMNSHLLEQFSISKDTRLLDESLGGEKNLSKKPEPDGFTFFPMTAEETEEFRRSQRKRNHKK